MSKLDLSNIDTQALTNYLRNTGNLNPEQEMAEIYKKQKAYFEGYQSDLIDDLGKSLDDTSFLDRGRRSAEALSGRSRSITDRRLSSTANDLLPSQKAAMNKRLAKGAKLGAGSILTSTRAQDKANKMATRQELMNISEQLVNTGTASMAGAAQSEMARKQRNDAASSSMMGTALGVVGGIAGFAMGGGPAGAMVGASIGQGTGSAFG